MTVENPKTQEDAEQRKWDIVWAGGLAGASVVGFLLLGTRNLHVLRLPTSRLEGGVAALYGLCVFLLGGSLLCLTGTRSPRDRRGHLERHESAIRILGRVLGLALWAVAGTVGIAGFFVLVQLRYNPALGYYKPDLAEWRACWYLGLFFGALAAATAIVGISDLMRFKWLRRFFYG